MKWLPLQNPTGTAIFALAVLTAAIGLVGTDQVPGPLENLSTVSSQRKHSTINEAPRSDPWEVADVEDDDPGVAVHAQASPPRPELAESSNNDQPSGPPLQVQN